MADEGKSTVHMTAADQLVLKAVTDLREEFGGMREIVKPLPDKINALVVQVELFPSRLTDMATHIDKVQSDVAGDIHDIREQLVEIKEFQVSHGIYWKIGAGVLIALLPTIIGATYVLTAQIAGLQSTVSILSGSMSDAKKDRGPQQETKDTADAIVGAATAFKKESEDLRSALADSAVSFRLNFAMKSSYLDTSEGTGETTLRLAYNVPYEHSADREEPENGSRGIATFVPSNSEMPAEFTAVGTIVEKAKSMMRITVSFDKASEVRLFQDSVAREEKVSRISGLGMRGYVMIVRPRKSR